MIYHAGEPADIGIAPNLVMRFSLERENNEKQMTTINQREEPWGRVNTTVNSRDERDTAINQPMTDSWLADHKKRLRAARPDSRSKIQDI